MAISFTSADDATSAVVLAVPPPNAGRHFFPHQGLLSLAGSLAPRSRVSVVDLCCTPYAALRGLIRQEEPLFLGLSCNYSQHYASYEHWIPMIRRDFPELLLVAGGQYSTFKPEHLLDLGVDVVCRGEGEVTIQEIQQQCLAGTADWSEVDGLCYREQGVMKTTPEQSKIKDLDQLPLPLHHSFPVEQYRFSSYRVTLMEFSRGCRYNCTYCTSSRFNGRFRKKSVPRILAEMRLLAEAGYDCVYVTDDMFLDDQDWAVSVLEALAQAKSIPFTIYIEPVAVIKLGPRLVPLLEQAGCVAAYMQADSLSDRVLRSFKKPYNVEMLREALHIMGARREMSLIGDIIVGAPGETVWEMLNTYRVARRHVDLLMINMLEPRPGNRLWPEDWDLEQVKKLGGGRSLLHHRPWIPEVVSRLMVLNTYFTPSALLRNLGMGAPVVKGVAQFYYSSLLQAAARSIGLR